jgi:uncharacterized protein YkwD
MKVLYLTTGVLLTLISSAFALDQSLSKQVLAEINLARTQPRSYAGFLREFRTQFRGTYYVLPGSTTRVQTSEGVKAVDEAISLLARVKPLPPMAWSAGLGAAAAELAEDQGRSGDTGHIGRQSRGMRERIERHGVWIGRIGENIGYGPEDARGVVMQLIIDDGIPGRGHRTNNFSTAYTTAGVACGSHPRYRSMCVIDFAGGFREKAGER